MNRLHIMLISNILSKVCANKNQAKDLAVTKYAKASNLIKKPFTTS